MVKLFFRDSKERYAPAHYLFLEHNLEDCLLAIQSVVNACRLVIGVILLR